MKPTAGALRKAARALRAEGYVELADQIEPRLSIKPKSKRGATVARHLKKDLGKITWADIKREVQARVLRERGGRCEWQCDRPCDDPHHIISGSGKKRVFEAPSTVAGICREHHRLYEKADIETLLRARLWAHEHGFTLAHAEITHRLDKAQAVRDATPSLSSETRR